MQPSTENCNLNLPTTPEALARWGYVPDDILPDVRIALERNPTLTYFGLTDNPTPEDRAALLKPGALHEILLCQFWLRGQTRRKTINSRFSSYGMKHRVENFYRPPQSVYVANGSFITAAIIDGWKVKRIDRTPNAHINISKISYRAGEGAL